MQVLILNTQSGDWEAMYIDGKLIDEGHTLGEGNNFYFLLEMAEKYGFTRADIQSAELNAVDDEEVSSGGSMPQSLSELTGSYWK